MSLSDWMTPDPVTIGPGLRLVEAVQKMVRHGVKHLPVIDKGRLLGVVSARTILSRLLLSPNVGEQLPGLGRKPVMEFCQPVGGLAPGAASEQAVAAFGAGTTCLPVVSEDRLVGVVSEGNLLRFLLSELTGKPIPPARRVSNTRIDVLLSIVRETSTSQDQGRILEVVCRHVTTVMRVDRAAILLLPTPESTSFLEHVHTAEPGLQPVLGGSVPLEGSLSGWTAASKESLRIDDLASQNRFPTPESWKGETGSVLSAPLLDDATSLGVLNLWSARPHSYLDSDLELVELIAANVASAVLHGRRHEREQLLVSELQEANRIKDEFLAVVTHDLRNAIQGMLAYTQLLPRKSEDEGIRKLASVLEESVHYMAGLTNDLHDLARLGMEAIRLNPAPVELDLVVDRVLREQTQLGSLNQVELRPRAGVAGLSLVADELRLRQILSNLVSNAIKYNRPGGWVEVRTARVGDQAVIEVEDSGHGIKRGEQEKVFDLFQQAANSRKVQGSGLGLSITRRLVQLHQGKLELQSVPGQGSTFRVRLPLAGPSL